MGSGGERRLSPKNPGSIERGKAKAKPEGLEAAIPIKNSPAIAPGGRQRSAPIYTRQPAIGLSYFGTSGMTNVNGAVERSNSGGDAVLAQLNTTFHHGDQLGSTRLTTSGGGWPTTSDTFYPFGPEPGGTAAPNHFQYAGLERDPETGLDHATFRQYASTTGRWMSPDPYDGSMDLGNPQSLNRYNYAENNPLMMTDPSGLDGGIPGIGSVGGLHRRRRLRRSRCRLRHHLRHPDIRRHHGLLQQTQVPWFDDAPFQWTDMGRAQSREVRPQHRRSTRSAQPSVRVRCMRLPAERELSQCRGLLPRNPNADQRY